jgi:hypothetical protein
MSSTFKFFPLLPTELRFKIWSLNLPPPRLVPLHYTPPSSNPTTLQGSTSPSPIPANLHACTESRYLALSHYQLSFALMHTLPKIFFNPRSDILYFGFRDGYMGSFKHFVNAVTLVERAELGRVRRLAVSEGLFVGLGNTSCLRQFWEYVRVKFTGVEEVIVVVEQQNTLPVIELQESKERVKGRENDGGERGFA